MSARELLRTREPIYKSLKLGERTLSDSALIDLMAEHPHRIQRQIVEKVTARSWRARPSD